MGLLHKPLHQLLPRLLLGLLATAPVVAESIPIRGRVVDEKGKGVAKAVVRLVPTVGHYSFAARELDHQDETAALLEVKSDAAGRFQLEAPEVGIWWLKADAPGRVGADLLLSPLIEEVDLPPAVLAQDAGMEVLVTTSDGKPAVGARVHGRSPAERSMRRLNWKPRSQRAWTDEEGRVRLFRVDGRRLAVRAFQAGSEEIDHQKTRGKRLTVPLPSAAAMLVEVRDHRNKPEAGAMVQLGEGGFVVGRTDEQGRLTIHVPKQGKMQVMAVTEDLRMFKTTLTLPKDPAKPHILQLPELMTIDGQVVTKDRKPVAGALVWGEIAQPVRSAADGRFRVREFAEDKTWLRAASPGYFEGAAEVRPGHSTTLILEANTLLRGRVVNAQGDPVAKVEIEGTWQFRRGGGRNRHAYSSGGLSRSNEQGVFRLSGLMPGESYELKFQRDGYAPLRHSLLAPEPGAEVATFVLLEGRRGSGMVVDENDEPVAGVEVSLYSELTNSNWTSRLMRPEDGPDFSASSGEDGTFQIDDLNAGRFRLAAQRSGFAPVAVPGIQIPEGGGETDLGILVMVPGERIEGRTVGAGGEPLSEVEIFVRSSQPGMFRMGMAGSDESAAAQTDAAGTFAIEDRRPEERFNLRAVKKGYATTELEGVQAPTETPVEIVMQLASSVAGRVVDEEGSPVAKAQVTIAAAQANQMTRRSQIQKGETDSEGRFSIDDVTPGDIRIQAQAKSFQASNQLEKVDAGKDLEGVEVILKPGATVVGKIVGPTGEPVAEAFVMVAIDNAMRMRTVSQPASARSDAEGGFRLEGVEPGRRSLNVRHDDYPTATEVVDLEPGETRVEIQLGGGQTVSGQVVDPEGSALAGATVRLSSTGRYFGGMGQGETSSADGLFEIGGVVDGKYTLIAEHANFASGRLEDVEVNGGPVSGLVVQLEGGATINGRILGLEFDELATAQIYAYSTEGGMRLGQVDYEEQYQIEQAAPAEWHVQVRTTSGRQARGTVTVAPGDTAVQLDIDFAGGTSLTGRVMRGGEPVAGVQLTVSSETGDSHATGTTDHQGKFQLQGLAEGTNKLFALDMATGMQHREDIELPASEPIEVILSAATISGLVVDAIDQSPISGATIRVTPTAEGDAQMAMITNMLGSASSDDRGHFTISSVAAGDWQVIAEKDGYSSTTQTLSVIGDGEVTNLELELTATEGLWLTIRGAGTARPAQVMIAMLGAAGNLSAESHGVDADGRVFLPSVPAGPVRLVAGSHGYGTMVINATAPTDRPVVSFTDEAIIEVQIPELEGEALPSQATLFDLNSEPVYLFTQFGAARTGHSVSAGKVTFTGLPLGAWTVEVKANDGRTWTRDITTTPGQRQVVVLDQAVKAGQ